MSAVPLQHGRKKSPDSPEQGQRIHLESPLDLPVRNVQQVFAGNYARVVDQDVDGTTFCQRLRRHGCYFIPACEITSVDIYLMAGAAEFGLCLTETFRVDIPQH